MIRDKKINYYYYLPVFSTTTTSHVCRYRYVHLTGPIIIITYFVIAFKNFMPCITNVGNFRPGWRDPFLSHQLPHCTMFDFHDFGLIFARQMHCLPQRLKSTLFEIFSNGGCPKGTRSVEKISNNIDFSL